MTMNLLDQPEIAETQEQRVDNVSTTASSNNQLSMATVLKAASSGQQTMVGLATTLIADIKQNVDHELIGSMLKQTSKKSLMRLLAPFLGYYSLFDTVELQDHPCG